MYKRMFMLALLLVSSARIAGAQRSQPVVQFHAPAGCPDQAFFTQRMHARLDADGVRPRPGSRVEVQLELAASRAKGSVRIQQAAGSALRSLEAASCKEVVEGLALIAALAIATRPSPPGASKAAAAPAVARPGPQAPIASESRDPTPNVSAVPSRASPGDAGALAPVQAASRDALAREPASEERGADRSEAETAAARTADEAEATEIDAPSGSEPRLRGLLIDAGLIAIHGPAPHVRPGLQLGAAVVLAHGALDWRLAFAGRLALPETLSSAQGTTRFGFVAGVVELCGAAVLGGAWSWHGCAVVEPGMLSASGENTRNARDYRRAWLALGGGTGLAVGLASWFALRAGAELLVPTRRDRALLAGEPVHHVPPVSLRFELGMEARAW